VLFYTYKNKDCLLYFIIKANERSKRTMDTQCRKELMKEKRIQRLIQKNEIEDAMNKLPINERAIIEDVLNQIIDANLADKLEQLNNQRNQRILIQASESAKAEAKAIGILYVGTIAYVGLMLITR
jgi:hypothetical protein